MARTLPWNQNRPQPPAEEKALVRKTSTSGKKIPSPGRKSQKSKTLPLLQAPQQATKATTHLLAPVPASANSKKYDDLWGAKVTSSSSTKSSVSLGKRKLEIDDESVLESNQSKRINYGDGVRWPATTSSIPPFLFRAASSASRGINTEDEIDPHFDKDRLEARPYSANAASIHERHGMLYSHLMFDYNIPSEFSSWSVSPLFVLKHAVRMACCKDPKAFKREPTDIFLYVMDTNKLPETNSLHSALELVEFHDIGPKHLLRSYAQGEYLCFGRVVNKNGELWQAVTFEALEAAGLWDLSYDLEKYRAENSLLQAAFSMRESYFPCNRPFATDWYYYGIAKRLGECFSGPMRTVVTLALLTIRSRDVSTDGDCLSILLEEIAAGELEMPAVAWTEATRRLKMEFVFVPEAKQFMQLLQLLRDQLPAKDDGDHTVDGVEHEITEI